MATTSVRSSPPRGLGADMDVAVPTPPPQTRPPRPPGVQRPLPHLQSDLRAQRAEAEYIASGGGSRPSSGEGPRSARSARSQQSQPSSAAGSSGLPVGGARELVQAQRAAAHAALEARHASGSRGYPQQPAQSALAAAPAGSPRASAASTRAPDETSAGSSSSRNASRPGSAHNSGGSMDAPVRWKWQPQSEDQSLRRSGLGAGHLRGRRANLAKIREIQGLGA
mmetsp:Transcript_7124/g.19134  ORF Transcript_7124/g.19134 Transcript_7124/m.19134 type:complete len:224 (-) Transcript_7124:41-712(-)